MFFFHLKLISALSLGRWQGRNCHLVRTRLFGTLNQSRESRAAPWWCEPINIFSSLRNEKAHGPDGELDCTPLPREKPPIFHSAIFVLCNGVAWWKVEERVPFEMPIRQVVFGGFVRDCKFFRVKRNEWLCNEVDCISNHRRDLVSRDQGRLSCHSPTICSQNP